MKSVVIIGGGVAGCKAAVELASIGYRVTVVEKECSLGGNLNNWDRLFPDGKRASCLVDALASDVEKRGVTVLTNVEPEKVELIDGCYNILLSDKGLLKADAVLITTGFTTFNAQRKEEYGYGIYRNVITSVDLENIFAANLLSSEIGRIGMVHCVGSRDEKCGNMYCSKVCCITAVKQAIELKQMLPNAEIFCFYMDMRMFGPGYEELYREAQEQYGIKFVRGRVSEASEDSEGRVAIKVEDTLVGRPMRMKLDRLVLMVGMEPSLGTNRLAKLFGVEMRASGFIKGGDPHTGGNITNVKGVFVAGAATSPMNTTDTINDACAAVLQIDKYLRQ